MAKRKRVLLAGLFHETHTFIEEITPAEAFRCRRGDELLAASNDGSPLSGMLEVAESSGWDVRPAIDLRAMPSGTVADSVLQTFLDELRQTVDREASAGIDGVALVLHGAMVTESVRDVEARVLEEIRSMPLLADVPVAAVLDLHGNISPRTAELATILVSYRTNPHTDARDAAIRTAELLDRAMHADRLPTTLFVQPPVMWPPTGTGTDDDPMRMLEAMAREIERADSHIAAVNVLGGFSFADTPHTGVSFSAVTFGDPAQSRKRIEELSDWTWQHREDGLRSDMPLEEAMRRVLEHVRRREVPVLLVEPADNIGGGAPGDGTTILRTLVERSIPDSGVIINDPECVQTARRHVPGDRFSLEIGGKASRLTDGPVSLEVELVSSSDGRFQLEDPHSHLAASHGRFIDMGPCAVVRHNGLYILLTSRKTPPFDLGQWRSQGIAPEKLSVIGVKAAVAHRRAYDRIARCSYTVATPGPCSSDLTRLPFRHVRRPIFPLDAS